MSGEFVNYGFPEISSILPLHGIFVCEYLEVLFLVEPILRGAWLALFEILHSQLGYGQSPYDWNEFVFGSSRIEKSRKCALHSCFNTSDFPYANR